MDKMIFRCPGPEMIWGVPTETKLIFHKDLEIHLKEGWFNKPQEAHAEYNKIKEQVRQEVEVETIEPVKEIKRGRPRKT